MDNRYWLVGVTLLGLLLLAGCASMPALRAPEVTGITPRIAGFDLRGVNLEFAVQVVNHYPVALVAPEFRYALDIADSQFISGTQAAGIDLPAGGVGTAVLPVRLNYLDLWRLYRSLKDASEVPYQLRGAFTVRALGQTFDLPLAKAGTFPVLRLPRFSEMRLQRPEYGGGAARVTVDCRMANPNIFALGLEQVGYRLAVGSIEVGGLSVVTAPELAAGGNSAMRLTGEVSAVTALMQILSGGRGGDIKITPQGTLRTPYGAVALGE